MKHFFRFQLFTLILLLSCAFQTKLKAQIDATKTPDWVQRLKKIPLQQADTATLDSIRNTIQGKEFNPETGKWEWRQFPYGLVKKDISNHSLQQLSEDTMKLYSLSDGFSGILKADSLGNLYKDTSDLISFGFQYNPSFIDYNNVKGKSIEFGDTTGQYKFNMPYHLNRWSNEVNIFNDNRKQYEPEKPEYGISRYSIWWHGTNHSIKGQGAFLSDWKLLWENRSDKQGNDLNSARTWFNEGRGRPEFDENQEPTGRFQTVEPNTNISLHRFWAYTPRPEDSSKVRGHLVGAYGFGTGTTDTLRYNENNGGQYNLYLTETGTTNLVKAFSVNDRLEWSGKGYQSNQSGIALFNKDGFLEKSSSNYNIKHQLSKDGYWVGDWRDYDTTFSTWSSLDTLTQLNQSPSFRVFSEGGHAIYGGGFIQVEGFKKDNYTSFLANSWQANPNKGSRLILRTTHSPSGDFYDTQPIPVNRYLGGVEFESRMQDEGGWFYPAKIEVYASKDSILNTAHKGARMEFQTTNNGTNILTSKLEITEAGEIKINQHDDGLEGYYKAASDGTIQKVSPLEAFKGLIATLPQYQNDSAAQAIGDLTVYEDFYINAETGAITKILIPLPVCDFGTPTAFDKSSQADPVRFFQLYYNKGGVFPSTIPLVGDSVTITIDGTTHVMTVQSTTPGLSIALSCPDGLHTQFGNGYYNNLISNMASFAIECN